MVVPDTVSGRVISTSYSMALQLLSADQTVRQTWGEEARVRQWIHHIIRLVAELNNVMVLLALTCRCAAHLGMPARESLEYGAKVGLHLNA